ncbi:MAG: nucleoside permease nupX, partial [Nitrospinae bacterium]|nr:nucleoside permease nupX [Nitrospinota bacterium]
MDENIYRLISFAGFFIVAFLAWATGVRKKINTKTIIGSMALAWVLGVLTFWVPWSRTALHWVNHILV